MRSLLKKILPTSVAHAVRNQSARVDRLVIRFLSCWQWTSSLYYAFFSRQFGREHQGVLRGRLAFWHSLENVKTTSALLRRNTHRLEKGLIMRPRRPVFAEDYILETVECLEKASQSSFGFDDGELRWALDVLSEYFNVVSTTKTVEQARSRFNVIIQSVGLGSKGPKFIPREHQTLPQSNISSDELHILFKRRRSTRWYLERPVPENLIRQAMTMAMEAPSACNRLPYRFFYTDERQKVTKLAGFAGGTVGFVEGIPSLIVVIGDFSAYPLERDRHCIYIDSSLASMQLMLALETMGLSTCPINWPDIEFREQLMQKELGLEDYERPIMLLAVGYADPAGGVPYSQKKPLGSISNLGNVTQ